MDKKLIRKLLASLLACAMLLANVAAFADDADPAANATTAPAEQVEETAETTEAKTGDTVTGDTDPKPTDPAPTDPAITDPEPTDPVVTNPEPTDPAITDPEPTDPADTDPEGDDAEDADTEAEKPVPPPINVGGVPNVDGAEGSEDNANAENGIAPMFLDPAHASEHKYELDPNSSSEPSIIITYLDEKQHEVYTDYTEEWRCKKCNDLKIITKSSVYNEDHYDKDGDGNCDACESSIKLEVCTHEGIQDSDWKLTGTDVMYQKRIYDMNTYKYLPESAGHEKHVYKFYTATCPVCGKEVDKMEEEHTQDPHDMKNGVCTICGYGKSSGTTKKATDNRVRMGVKLAKELTKLAKAGSTVSLYNEKLVYTEAELASVTAINNPLERALMLLAALGYGDEVDYAIKNQGLTVSAEARAIIDQIRARGVIPGGVVAFQTTAKVNGKSYDAVTISMVVSGSNGVATKSFTFYKDGSKLYFAD